MVVSGQLHAQAALPPYAGRERGPSWSGRCGVERTPFYPLPRVKPQFLGSPVHGLVGIPTPEDNIKSDLRNTVSGHWLHSTGPARSCVGPLVP
jgi:hypothetical protein